MNKPIKSPAQPKNGYTTGSCAAAATQAALQKMLFDKELAEVEVDLPEGGLIRIPVKKIFLQGNQATAEVTKDAGDDPDVTDGLSILATVKILDQPDILIEGGLGVGRVKKPGLAVAVGEAAINPGPRSMITAAVKKILPLGKGAQIVISVPGGEEAACKTMNPRLGIEGGISILGTSGIVRPMSEAGYLDSLVPQIDQAVALGYHDLLLTPGQMGERLAKSLGITGDCIIQTSNFIGPMVQECAGREVEGILLMGHIGKIIKVAAGIFNTHSRTADARRETLAAHAALNGASVDIIKEIMGLNTMEAGVELLRKHKLLSVYFSIAASASQRIRELLDTSSAKIGLKVGTILYALDGEILGYDDAAAQLYRKMTGRNIRLESRQPSEMADGRDDLSLNPQGMPDLGTVRHYSGSDHQIVTVVGTGPGDPLYISPLAQQAIENAEVIVGAPRLLTQLASSQQVQVPVDRDLPGLVEFIEEKRHQQKIVVLVSGDTGVYSLADYLGRHMDNEVLEFIPGISSIQVMFARLKRPWQQARIISMHGRNWAGLAEAINDSPLTAILTGTPWTPQAIAQYLLQEGLPDLKVVLGQDLTYPREKIVFCSLQELSRDSHDYYNTVMVIFNE